MTFVSILRTDPFLNQYTNRTVPGAVDIIGSATSTATVTVHDQTTYRKGNYYRAQVAVDNSSAPVWQPMTNQAALNERTNFVVETNITGNVFVPQNPETFAYDLDGNLTNDGRWIYTWDAENRLISMTNNPNVPTGAQMQLNFLYDAKGRRVCKTVITNGVATTNNFAYDGWNLLSTFNLTSSSLAQSFIWGLDLSGSIEGAGGVGGLLFESQAGQHSSLLCYDGNGNVLALADGTTSAIAAQYEYGPFGEVIRATGPMARASQFRFSTKYHDLETDLIYYGYRYFNCGSSKWLSRDPIEEKGGINLNAFDQNNTVNKVDFCGLDTMLIIQGEEWKDHSDVFSRAAMFTAALYAGGKHFNPCVDAVVIVNLTGTKDNAAHIVEAAFQKVKAIRYVVYVGHSGENFLFLDGDQGSGSNLGILDVEHTDDSNPYKYFLSTSISHLDKGNLTPHAFAILEGCRTGHGIAPALAVTFGKPVLATPAYVNFQSNGGPFVRWWRRLFVGGWKWYGGEPLKRSETGRDAEWSQAEANQVSQELNSMGAGE